MKKIWQALLLLPLLFLLISKSSYSNSVSTNVNVNTNVNSSNTVTTSSDCKTKIRTEVNGVVKEVESSECGSVHVEANESGSRVQINGNDAVTSTPKNTPPSNATITPKPTTNMEEERASIEAKVKEQIKGIQDEQKDFLKRLEEFLTSLFDRIWPL